MAPQSRDLDKLVEGVVLVTLSYTAYQVWPLWEESALRRQQRFMA